MAEVATTAEEARRGIITSSPTLFFSSMRLGSVRGRGAGSPRDDGQPADTCDRVRPTADLVVARQVQEAGGFFEPTAFVPYALKQYFSPTLPPRIAAMRRVSTAESGSGGAAARRIWSGCTCFFTESRSELR